MDEVLEVSLKQFLLCDADEFGGARVGIDETIAPEDEDRCGRSLDQRPESLLALAYRFLDRTPLTAIRPEAKCESHECRDQHTVEQQHPPLKIERLTYREIILCRYTPEFAELLGTDLQCVLAAQ